MHRLRSGLNANTKKHLLLGEGAIFKNFEVGVDTYESAKAAGKLLGACQGGSTFNAVANVRQIAVDGIPGNVADLEEIDSWDVSLETTFLEVTAQTIMAALGAAKGTYSDGYTKIEGKLDFASSDYFDNITFVGSLSGTNTPIILQVLNAIGNGNLSLNIQNGDEAKVPCTFQGRYRIETLTDVPFAIYYPDIMQASTDTITVAKNSTGTVTVTGYKTSLTCTSSDSTKATASAVGGTVTVSGVAAGKADITVTDADSNSLVIKATVTSA